MTNSVKRRYSEVEAAIRLIPVQKPNEHLILVNTNFLFEEIKLMDKNPIFPVIVRLLLPKSIIFDPLQNDHIALQSYKSQEEIMLSWKVKCLNLPCSKEEIILEVTF